MVVGVLDIRIALPESRSLKDKRRVVNSLKDRLRRRFNVSVAEVDEQDLRQIANLAVAQVSGDARYVRASLEQVLKVVRQSRGAELADHAIEVFHR